MQRDVAWNEVLLSFKQLKMKSDYVTYQAEQTNDKEFSEGLGNLSIYI
jgi:hypothetical protein